MVWIAGGTFLMGSNDFYPEERPAHRVAVAGFWIDRHPVTNREFAEFVRMAEYVTVAERTPNRADYPGIDPAMLVPGSLVFKKPPRSAAARRDLSWWSYVPGASWRCPEGPASDLSGRDDHPVVHIAYEDAEAYARWAGKALPTEAEWEFAARGGLDSAVFTWGRDCSPDGQQYANTWQGEFPWENLCLDGYERTSPVGVFPANGFGLYDMAGNVWEWTADMFAAHPHQHAKACCVPKAGEPAADIPRRVVKGGSYLCAPNYCFRYRPAARQGEAIDTSACHIGFRCVARTAAPAG